MQKRRIRTAALFLALLMLFAPVNAGLLSQASSEPELNTKVTFAESYAVGTRISIPNAEFADASGSYATTAKVISPDGNEHIGNSFTIQNKGTHTVVYSAVVGNEEVKKEFTFSAYYPLFSVEKKSSGTPYYGASSMYGGISGRDGVVVSLSSGDTFHWGEIIDLKGKTSLDSLIKLYVTPQTLGKADTSKICVILTDIYNPDNYVTVTFKKVIAVMVGAQWAEVNSFVTAGSSKQLQTGMRQDNVKGTFEYEGQMYYLEAGTKMGTQVSALSLPGTPKYVQDNDASVSAELFLANPQLMTVSFDYENAKVFAGRIDADANNSDPNKTDIKLIADLDAEQCFDTLWGGFTTGEVYLSIKGQEYLSSSLNFVVTEVNGESVSDKVSNGNTVTDNVPPALTVSAPSPIPNALVGVPYTLFPASAADIYDGEIKPTVTVKQGTTVVEVKNGQFIPTKEGNYTVTYRATDYAGNATRDTANRYTVTAVTGNPLSATLGSYETTGYLTGLPVTVADFTTADARGTVDAFITAKCKDRVYDVKDGAFIPLDVGEYTVEYIVTDYIGKTNLSYTVTVGENPDAVIIGTPALPLYYMSGMIYSAPKLDAYTWKNGIPQKTACDVYYGSDGVTYRKAGDLFTPTSSDTVYLKFSINTEGKTAESVFTVPAVDVGYNQNKLAMENYFHFTQGTPTVSADGKSILYTLNGDSAFTYVNL